MKKQVSPTEKFYRIDPTTGCWLWFGNTCKKGYGKYKINGKSYKAHRYVYEQHKGPIPKGLQLDHFKQRTHGCPKNCVNPDHLEPVTGTENIRRSVATKITREQAIQIHRLNRKGKWQKDIAFIFNISQTQISNIILKKSWSDITEEEINASETT